MKKSILLTASMLVVMLLTAFNLSAQNPVTWKAAVNMTSATEGQIVITAKIEKGWHVYGFKQSPDGPNSTTVKMSYPKGLTFTGKMTCSPLINVMDDMFGVEVSYWENAVTLTRRFKIEPGTKGAISVDVNYMACNDSSCMPPKTDHLTAEIK